MSRALAAPPTVSVLIPAYNRAEYLAETLDSVLNQSLRDFELIVVDDGSTDNTPALLEQYQQQDQRVRSYRQPNRGVVTARNKCLELARGKYIAWLDSDDLMVRERLEKQVAFLDANPAIGACGSAARTFGYSRSRVLRFATHNDQLQPGFLFGTPMTGATIMMRRAVIEEYNLRFDPFFQVAEDYDFLARAAQYMRFATLPDVLYLYRQHIAQTTRTETDATRHYTRRIQSSILARLGVQPDDDEMDLHLTLVFAFKGTPRACQNQQFVAKAEQWLRRLETANQVHQVFSESGLAYVLGLRWFAVCHATTALGPWLWRKYWSSQFSVHYPLQLRTKAKFFVNCWLRQSS